MKIRIFIYLLVLFIGLGLFFSAMRSKIGVYDAVTKSIFPNTYCSQFSGMVSYAWSIDGDQSCIKNGCMVTDKVEFGMNDMALDNEGYKFNCRAKK